MADQKFPGNAIACGCNEPNREATVAAFTNDSRYLTQEAVFNSATEYPTAEQEIAQPGTLKIDHRESYGTFLAEAVSVVARHDCCGGIGHPPCNLGGTGALRAEIELVGFLGQLAKSLNERFVIDTKRKTHIQ